MLDFGVFFFLQNILIITLLFWGLSFVGQKFFKRKDYKPATEVFECGFFTTHKLNLTFNYNFFLIATLLILYDVEFFFLLPFLFNLGGASVLASMCFVIFVVLVVVSFIYDWEAISLNWCV